MAQYTSTSKIEGCIRKMEELIAGSRRQILNTAMISINREEIEILLRELKNSIPEEVEHCRQIVSKSEAIERQARDKADRIVAEIEEKKNQMLSENEIILRAEEQAEDIVQDAIEQAGLIVGQAQAQADEILDDAQYQANEYMQSAVSYLNRNLHSIQSLINDSINETTRHANKLLDSLSGIGDTIQDNIDELNGVARKQEQVQEPPMTEQAPVSGMPEGSDENI